jgi:stage II sporulation protein Q
MIAEVMKMREEENKRSSQGSSVKRFFKKRWVFPAIYIASAAIILTGVLWYQSSDNATDKYSYDSTENPVSNSDKTPAVEVNKVMENFKMPVENADEAVIKMGFYDSKASDEDQEAALVFYNNTYHQNTGVDIALENGESFEVVAALSGEVTRVDEDAVLGNVIEIEHDKGIVTQYQSVKDVKVKVGDQVKQGQALAMAGQSLFNEEAGTHVHFEIRKEGVAVNPSNYFNKSLSVLQQEKLADEEAPAADKEPASTEDKKKVEDPASSEEEAEEGTPTEDESSESTEKTNS